MTNKPWKTKNSSPHKDALEECKPTWWTCYNCGASGCHGEQAFNGRIVPFCVNCYKEYVDKRGWRKREQFDRYVQKNLLHIGSKLYDAVVKYIEDKEAVRDE